MSIPFRGAVAGTAALVALFACAGRPLVVPPGSPYAVEGLSAYDAALRHAAATRDTSAPDRIAAAGPRDRLVRALNRGLLLHRVGEPAASNAALGEAERLAEERYTKAITQQLGAFLLSDRVIDYTPAAHERAMLHYYRMLNFLRLGDEESALVEARRANAFLYRYYQDHDGRRSYANDAFVEWVAGLLHWGAGDLNDAFVSLRLAEEAFGRYERDYGVAPPPAFAYDLVRVALAQGADEIAEGTVLKYDLDTALIHAARRPGQGELVVLVEEGFAPYRREEKLFIPVLPEDRALVDRGDPRSAVAATVAVLARAVVWMNQASREGRAPWREVEGGLLLGSLALDADLIALAWPALAFAPHSIEEATVQVTPREPSRAATQARAVVAQDLSAIAARDFEEETPRYLSRMVVRALAKEAAVLSAEQAAEAKVGKVAGAIAGSVARAAAVLTERADTRSWTLLPHTIRVARFTLPAGRHTVRVTVRDRTGQRAIALEPVDMRPGAVTVRSVFVTGADPGDRSRYDRARRAVEYTMPGDLKPRP